jgi:hypothetical protein
VPERDGDEARLTGLDAATRCAGHELHADTGKVSLSPGNEPCILALSNAGCRNARLPPRGVAFWERSGFPGGTLRRLFFRRDMAAEQAWRQHPDTSGVRLSKVAKVLANHAAGFSQ